MYPIIIVLATKPNKIPVTLAFFVSIPKGTCPPDLP